MDIESKSDVLSELPEFRDCCGALNCTAPTVYIFPSENGRSCLLSVGHFSVLLDGTHKNGQVPSYWGLVGRLPHVNVMVSTSQHVSLLASVQSMVTRKALHPTLSPSIGMLFADLHVLHDNENDNVTQNQMINRIRSDALNSGLRIQPLTDDKKSVTAVVAAKKAIGKATSVSGRSTSVKSSVSSKAPIVTPIQLYYTCDVGALLMYVLPAQDAGSKPALLFVFTPSDPLQRVVRVLYSGDCAEAHVLKGMAALRAQIPCLTMKHYTESMQPADTDEHMAPTMGHTSATPKRTVRPSTGAGLSRSIPSTCTTPMKPSGPKATSRPAPVASAKVTGTKPVRPALNGERPKTTSSVSSAVTGVKTGTNRTVTAGKNLTVTGNRPTATAKTNAPVRPSTAARTTNKQPRATSKNPSSKAIEPPKVSAPIDVNEWLVHADQDKDKDKDNKDKDADKYIAAESTAVTSVVLSFTDSSNAQQESVTAIATGASDTQAVHKAIVNGVKSANELGPVNGNPFVNAQSIPAHPVVTNTAEQSILAHPVMTNTAEQSIPAHPVVTNTAEQSILAHPVVTNSAEQSIPAHPVVTNTNPFHDHLLMQQSQCTNPFMTSEQCVNGNNVSCKGLPIELESMTESQFGMIGMSAAGNVHSAQTQKDGQTMGNAATVNGNSTTGIDCADFKATQVNPSVNMNNKEPIGGEVQNGNHWVEDTNQPINTTLSHYTNSTQDNNKDTVTVQQLQQEWQQEPQALPVNTHLTAPAKASPLSNSARGRAVPGAGSSLNASAESTLSSSFSAVIRAQHYVLSEQEPSTDWLDAWWQGVHTWTQEGGVGPNNDQKVMLIATHRSQELSAWLNANIEGMLPLGVDVAPAAESGQLILEGAQEGIACAKVLL